MGDRITYVGLDVHKDGIVVALAEGGLRGEVRMRQLAEDIVTAGRSQEDGTAAPVRAGVAEMDGAKSRVR